MCAASIDEAYIILASYLNNCFDSLAIYYRNDITFKLNKKSRSIIEQAPTLKVLQMLSLK
jgi:hypothetical protein